MLRVAVITPYFNEPLNQLERCHNSVKMQDYPAKHIFVADGLPKGELDRWDVDHITLPRSHNDIGSTPRLIGAIHAIGLAYDAIAFLDADNWYHLDHISSLVRLHLSRNAQFVSSSRYLCAPSGEVLGRCPNTDPEFFIDTNCMMFFRKAFYLLNNWSSMPAYAHIIGDRVILYHVRCSGIARAHSDRATVYYQCKREGIYRQLGLPVPPDVGPMPNYSSAFAQWEEDGFPSLREKRL